MIEIKIMILKVIIVKMKEKMKNEGKKIRREKLNKQMKKMKTMEITMKILLLRLKRKRNLKKIESDSRKTKISKKDKYINNIQ